MYLRITRIPPSAGGISPGSFLSRVEGSLTVTGAGRESLTVTVAGGGSLTVTVVQEEVA